DAPPSKATQISQHIKEIASTDILHVERTLEPVGQSFRQFKGQISSTIDLARSLEALSWEKVPEIIQDEVLRTVNLLHGLMRQLREFKLDPSRPANDQGQQLFSTFRQQSELGN